MIVAKQQAPVDCEVLVVGGGITGTAAAYYLSRECPSVVLVEERDLNTQASGRNAGSLHGQLQFEPYRTRGREWATAFVPALRFLADSIAVWQGLGAELGEDLEVSVQGGLLVADTEEQADLVTRKVELENAAGFPTEMSRAPSSAGWRPTCPRLRSQPNSHRPRARATRCWPRPRWPARLPATARGSAPQPRPAPCNPTAPDSWSIPVAVGSTAIG